MLVRLKEDRKLHGSPCILRNLSDTIHETRKLAAVTQPKIGNALRSNCVSTDMCGEWSAAAGTLTDDAGGFTGAVVAAAEHAGLLDR